jgi:hypothetical protein
VRLRFVGEYARFENMDSFDDEARGVLPSALPINDGFEQEGKFTYTVQSSMNNRGNQRDDDFGPSIKDEAPF